MSETGRIVRASRELVFVLDRLDREALAGKLRAADYAKLRVEAVRKALRELLVVEGGEELYRQLLQVGKVHAILMEMLKEEREACARIVEAQPYYPGTGTGMRQQWVKEQIAAAIRARSKA